MAAATQTQPNGTTPPNLKIVERLDSVPVVHDSVAYAEHLIKSTQLTASLYQTCLNIASRAYQTATPVIERTKPLIESADNLAVATFDRAESAFPYPFKTQTQDLIGVKQAKTVYDQRLAPALEEVLKKTSAINTELGTLQNKAAEALHKGSEVSHELVEQLKALADQSKGLPNQLIEGLGKVTNDVKSIVLAKDGTVQEKTNKLGAYVVEQVKPIIDEIYKHVIGAKKQAVEATHVAVDKAEDKANKATKEANEFVNSDN